MPARGTRETRRVIADAFTRHGGALDAARRVFPDAPLPWLDLSTGINPQPYPVGILDAAAWTRLPEEAALARLEEAAATRYGAPPWTVTVAAPGTQAVIARLPALLGCGDVRLLGRTYGEFERTFVDAGARITRATALEGLSGADIAIVVNPNNPDGRTVAVADLLPLATRVGTLVVDEAFADALPVQASIVPRLPPSRVVVLRSFGKIYGLAGLRLGFAILPPSLAGVLRGALGPWATSGPALAVGARALTDGPWLAATRARLDEDGARLAFLLRRAGAEPLGATPLFRLVAHAAAPALFVTLARRGILVRPFAREPRRLRFGLPGTEGDWRRLEEALRAFG